MTIVTYRPNKLGTSGITTAMTASEAGRQPRLSIFAMGETTLWFETITSRGVTFRKLIGGSNQSIEEIWIIWVFINAGTHSMVLSQYISVPAKVLLLTGIHYQSLCWYGMDSELRMDLLDVPISMYEVPNCRCLRPKPGDGWSVTVPVLPSTKQYTSLAASIMDCPRASCYADAIVQRKHVCSVRYATETIAVRSSSPQASSFWTVVGHTSPRDTNSGTTWSLFPRKYWWWHSPNSLGFAAACWELRYRDLWKRHQEPAEVVTLAGWMCEHGAVAVVAVVAAEGGPHGNPEWLLPARRDTKGVSGRRGLAPWWANR